MALFTKRMKHLGHPNFRQEMRCFLGDFLFVATEPISQSPRCVGKLLPHRRATCSSTTASYSLNLLEMLRTIVPTRVWNGFSMATASLEMTWKLIK
ncbi:hypothetical protein PI124_g23943 [Phytophthora idaei]|nr:hypothetical protein PI124_g23943 [Phytophthora idaei]